MNDHELEELLRARPEPLRPPPGRWETVRRRARRRRIAKLSATVLAMVVVIGGGLTPLLLMNHDHASGQRLSIAAAPSSTTGRSAPKHRLARSTAPTTPTPSPTPTKVAILPATSTPAGLAGFHPQSVSFVSQQQGFLLGTTAGSRAVLAATTDAGRSWSRLVTLPSSDEDAGVRFATAQVGFLFGSAYAVTTDGGRSWTTQPSPGDITDLETMDGHVYALVSQCGQCGRVSLFSATTASPALEPVSQVPTLAGGFASLAVAGDAAYVLSTAKGSTGQVWATLGGRTWTRRSSPCGRSYGVITEWSSLGVAAACNVQLFGAGEESKRVFVSTDGAQRWTPLANRPSQGGYIDSITASGPDDVVLGDARSGIDVTTDGGRHWAFRGPGMDDDVFVGFISPTHVVAIPATPLDRFFTTSYDSGRTWVTTRFPN